MKTPQGVTLNTRATRGTGEYRHQPTLRFPLRVPASLYDGSSRFDKGERVGTRQQGYLGPVIRDRIPYLTTTSRADLMSAFNKRVNYHDAKRIDPYIRKSAVKLIRRLVPKRMPRFDSDDDLFSEWVGQFDSEKQTRMKKARAEAGLDKLKDYTRKEIFTKIEALVKDPDTVAPRVIFKGSDYYNMVAGPIFKVLMDRFSGLGDQLGGIRFRMAYRQHTPDIVSFLESQPSKSWIEADFSSNDKTQVKDVHQLETMLMDRLGAPKWFLDLHRRANRFPVLNMRYGISAVIENQLATGAVDTTFRNTFWNLCIFYSWAQRLRVKKAVVAILGDDMLAGLPRRVRRASRHYQQIAKMARMDAKVTTGPHLHNCHFLSKHFVPVMRGEQQHVMLPFLGKVLSKFNARANANEAVTDDEYMAGKALSHCYEFRFCHVLRDLFVKRANYHLARSGGRYSLEGVTWHVRHFAAYPGEIEKLIENPMGFPDLVTPEDLTIFWITMANLTFPELVNRIKEVILGPEYRVLDHEVLNHLVDY